MVKAKAGHPFVETVKQSPCNESLKKLAELDAAGCEDSLEGRTSQVLTDVLHALKSQAEYALVALATCSAEAEAGVPEDGGEAQPAAEEEHAEKVLLLATHLAGRLLLADSSQPLEALHELVACLHDSLLGLGTRTTVQDEVAALCCCWWQQQAVGKEDLVAQTVPYLLVRAVTTGKAAFVKACFGIRGALQLMDYEDPSIVDVKRLILRSAFSAAFLARPEGCKFISSLFTLDPQVTRELTCIVKNQVPGGSKKVQQSYGSILFRAWRDATGPCLRELESSVQELMGAAIFARSEALAAGLRVVLDGFHSQKRLPAVDSMLLRLYEPILFRNTSVANPAVRCNALKLLFEAFPLMDPEGSNEDVDTLLTRQFVLFSDALSDAAPSVRITAVTGVCTVLNCFWELIPSATAAGYVARLTGELAHDMSVPGVRVAVLEGISLLLDNQHAQAVLMKVLPKLVPRLGDPSPHVRQTMAHLLKMISESASLRGQEMVPLEQLLEVMAHDTPDVSHPIQQLLLTTYYPSPQEGPALLADLLRRSPKQGQAFCSYLVAHLRFPVTRGRLGLPAKTLTAEQLKDLAQALASHLAASPPALAPPAAAAPASKRRKQSAKQLAAAAARSKKPATGKRRTNSGAAGIEAAGSSPPREVVEPEHSTPEAWAAVLVGLEVICSGLAAAVEHELCEADMVQDLFEPPFLLHLHHLCPDHQCRKSVLAMACALPQTAAARKVRDHCFDELLVGLAATATTAAGGSSTSTSTATTGAAAAAAAAAQGDQQAALLECCFSSNAGAKLVAAVEHALQPATSTSTRPRAPAPAQGHSQAAFDNDTCHVCGETEPEATLLLCDGCDAAYHTSCLQPRLRSVPQGRWLCPVCTHHVSRAAMTPEAALSCLCLALQQEPCRLAMLEAGSLSALLPRVQAHAALRCSSACQQLREQGGSAAGDAPAAASSMALYARAALHIYAAAVMGLLEAQQGGEDGEEQAGPATSDAIAQQVLGWCQELQAALELRLRSPQSLHSEGGDDAASDAMRCLEELLMLLADMLHLGLLSSTTSLLAADAQLQQVAATATATARMLLAAVTHKAGHHLAPFGRTWPQGLPVVLLAVAKQLLAAAVPEGHGSGTNLDSPQARAPRGGQAGLQLEPLLGDDADADGSLCHHQLAAAVMALLCTPSAEPLLQALRPQLTSFVSTAVRRSQAWLVPLLKLVGEAAFSQHQGEGGSQQEAGVEGGEGGGAAGPARPPPLANLRKVRLGRGSEAASVRTAEGAEGAMRELRLPALARAVATTAKFSRLEVEFLDACSAASSAHCAGEEQLLCALGAVSFIAVMSPAKDDAVSVGAGAKAFQHLQAAFTAISAMQPTAGQQALFNVVVGVLADVLHNSDDSVSEEAP